MGRTGVFLILGMLILLAFGWRLRTHGKTRGSAPTEPAKASPSSALSPSSIGVE